MMVAPCVLVVHTHEYLVEVMSSRVFVVDLKNSHERDHWNDESRIHPPEEREEEGEKEPPIRPPDTPPPADAELTNMVKAKNVAKKSVLVTFRIDAIHPVAREARLLV